MKPRGSHPEKALSPIKVRNVTVPGKYGDGNGLYLIADPSGAKRWVLRTVVHGRRRDIGLGGLRFVSLAEAREEALQLRKLTRQGGDPLIERRNERRVGMSCWRSRILCGLDSAPGNTQGTRCFRLDTLSHSSHWRTS